MKVDTLSDVTSERIVLSGLLRGIDHCPEILEILSATDFYESRHADIWSALLALTEQAGPRGIALTPERLYVSLQERGAIRDAGQDAIYLQDLWEIGASGGDIIYYAQRVRDKSILRCLERLGQEILSLVRKPTDSAEAMLSQVEQSIYAIAERGALEAIHCVADLIPERLAAIDARAARGGGLSGLDTGFDPLNELTAGFQDSELIILAARPGVGKTALAVHFAHHLAINCDLPVLFFSLEQSRAELTDRILVCESAVDAQRLRTGKLSAEEAERIASVGRVSGTRRLWIDDSPCQTMTRLAAKARRMKRQHGIRCVLVDYLQLIIPETAGHQERRHEQVAVITRKLKFLARELEVPVVSLAQLNRAPEERADRRPRLADLRESGSIEQDADLVMLLHADAQESQPGITALDVDIAKQRNGPTGSLALTFEKNRMKFYPLSYDEEGDIVHGRASNDRPASAGSRPRAYRGEDG